MGKIVSEIIVSNLYSWLPSTHILEENTCFITVFLKQILCNVDAEWS